MNYKNKIVSFAHAGGKKTLPENTLKAFRNAIELGADFIEFDLRLSKDNEIVIFHDPDTYDITSVPGLIKDSTLKELKMLNVGDGEKIPTFREVVELADHKINLLLHIAAANMEAQIVSLLREYDYIDTTIASCMVYKYLFNLRDIEPKLKLAVIEDLRSEEIPNWITRKKLIDNAANSKVYAINPEHHLVDAQFVTYAHQRNIKVFPWTVNVKDEMESLIHHGVDGIITDDVPLINKLLIPK
jgi:glycerophosphoryl diester phosphodiesterase